MPIRSPTAAEPPPRIYAGAGDLPDLNVWLALVVESHVHFERARRYWREDGARAQAIHFCRHTMLGLLRLLTQPRLMGVAVCSPAQALDRYLALLALPEVEMTQEPPECERTFLEYSRQTWFVPRLWTDAYLAAFARSARLRLVTFDADFERFEGLHRLRLD